MTTVEDRFETPGARMERVTFESQGEELAGAIYRPERGQADRLPAVVVAGTWTTVKEQMAGLYARRLAAEGIAALAFDLRHYGESGGAPREFESPTHKVADINAAVGFLAGRPDVDAGRLGAVGVCASAMYMSANAAQDPRIRSLVLVAPWIHDADVVREVYGGENGVNDRIERGRADASRWAESGEVAYVPAVSIDDGSAAMVGDAYAGYYLDPARGNIERWPNRFALMSWPEWLGFDGFAAAPGITQPTLIVHTRDAALPASVERFAERLPGAHQVVWTEGIQFDFYDQEPQVSTAVRAAADHLRQTLGHE
jgi:uncharacterized protein